MNQLYSSGQDEFTTEKSSLSVNQNLHGQEHRAKRKFKTKFDNDRINESASEDSQGIKMYLQDHEYHAQDGKFDVNAYMNQKLEQNIDISTVDIFSLARHGRKQELKKVLELGVDPNSKDRYGNTILIIGAQNGNKAIVKVAMKHGGLINMTNCSGNTALHFATEFQNEKVKEYLLRKGANASIKNVYGFKALQGIRHLKQENQ